MKKLRRLILLTLSATLLGGCSLFELAKPSEETATLEKLEAESYTAVAYKDETYTFDGIVKAFYSNNSFKVVTNYTVSDLDTSKLGNSPLVISYTENNFTTNLSLLIPVVERSSNVPVEGVSLSLTSKTMKVGESFSLSATISPANATNKQIRWISSKPSVATVNNGNVVAVANGTTNIIVSTIDGNKTAICSVTVSNEKILVTNVSFTEISNTMAIGDTYDVVYTVLPSNASNKTLTWASSNSTIASVSSTGRITAKAAGTTTITAKSNDGSNKQATLNVTVSSDKILVTSVSFTINSKTMAIGDTYDVVYTVLPSNASNKSLTWSSSRSTIASVSSTGRITAKAAGTATITAKSNDGSNKQATLNVTVSNPEVAVTGISLNETSLSLKNGEQAQLTATVSPSNATDKTVTWSGSANGITVNSSGLVSVSSTATVGKTATIVATAHGNTAKTASCVVTVAETLVGEKDAWTILIYMCGSDLESNYANTYDYEGNRQYGCATSDLMEIASVKNQPSDINIAVQAGGSKKWDSTYSSIINKDKCNRFHLSGQKYVIDSQTTKVNMGLESSLKNFIEWGLTTYPAEKTGLILWNHGGAMRGVCYDELANNDSLTNDEVVSAVSSALSSTGTTGKLEFIGYDACLMAVQDVAEFNSEYFNYMVCSEESEAGAGWDYDTWIDDLYAKKSTTTILKAICDGFITDNGGVNGSGNYWAGDYGNYYEPANQTLSYLDLSYMSAYKSAFEDMATALKSKITKSNATSFRNNVIGKTYSFGYDYEYDEHSLDYFGVIDVQHFFEVLKTNSTFNPGDTYINNALYALDNLVAYSTVQKEAAHDAHGLALYFVGGTSYGLKSYCSSTYSNFTNWNYININYGGTVNYTYEY